MIIIVQQETASIGATTVQQVYPTDLGPCVVRVQHGTGNRSSGSKIADVYFHGAAGTWATFDPLLSGTPDRDRVLIDLPGWGASTQDARLEHFSPDAMSRAVTGILDSLGYLRWNLVGHSMGGFLALHIAARWPDRTASVAAISATTFAALDAAQAPLRSLPTFPAFVGMLVLMRSMAALGPAGSALVRAVAGTPVMGPLMSPFFADPAAVSADVTRGLGLDARPAAFSAVVRSAAGYDFSQWRSIRCPAMAVRGERDVFAPPTDVTRLTATISHLEAVTIPRCGHFAHVEQPERVQQLLQALHCP